MHVLCTAGIAFTALFTLIGTTSVWQQTGKVLEGDWEVIDATRHPLYLEIARHEALLFQAPSGFRIVVQRVIIAEKMILGNVVKYRITFSFIRSRCSVEEDYNEDKCRPENDEHPEKMTTERCQCERSKVQWGHHDSI
uniref:Putative cystatin n=1 Tax=Rhipicephalus microplus TaxID=6941 RepID=A0A6G5A6Z4_RHIMP